MKCMTCGDVLSSAGVCPKCSRRPDTPRPAKPKLLKVTLEFDNEIHTLEGEYAQKWLEAVNGVLGLHQARGLGVPELAWVHKYWKVEVKR